MKKLFLISLLVIANFCTNAQSLTINNNTSCIVYYAFRGYNVSVCSPASPTPISYQINPHSSTTYASVSSVTWYGGGVPTGWLDFAASDNPSSFPVTNFVGISTCLDPGSSYTYMNTCGVSVNYTWSTVSGNVTVTLK
ncbi:MAG TPA: hypothetical protein VN721_17110 [Flavipsychrobacter sp.]|nr:hypothetical protein [Flavipsychrobacter sp.]